MHKFWPENVKGRRLFLETCMYIEDIIKTKLKVIGFVSVSWIQMALNRDQLLRSCIK
jgi:hypothetical protein